MTDVWLTSRDPEPPIGTIVEDDGGTRWVHDGDFPPCWLQVEHPEYDPESWTKVAGNYGPVKLIELGDGPNAQGWAMSD